MASWWRLRPEQPPLSSPAARCETTRSSRPPTPTTSRWCLPEQGISDTRTRRTRRGVILSDLLPGQIPHQARGDRQLRQREARSRNLVDRRTDPLNFRLPWANPFLYGTGAGTAVADHGGSQPPLGVADRIERPVQRKTIEVV